MTTAKIGPIDLDNPHLTDDKTDTDNNEAFTVVCENYKAKQIMGFADEIKDEKHGQLSITSTNNPWGIVPIDGSTYLADNDDFAHRGYYLIKKATPSFMNSDFSSLNLELKKVANFKEYITMDYRPHTDTDTLIHTNYADLTQVFKLNDPLDTFDTTNNWFATSSYAVSSPSITSSSGKLVFSGLASTYNTFGNVYTQTRNTYNAPFTVEFDLEKVANPASGHPEHNLCFILTPTRQSGAIVWKNMIYVVMRVTSTAVKYEVRSINSAGTSTVLIPLTTDNTTVHKWKLELGTNGYATISLDIGSGYIQKYYGPTTLSTYNNLYAGYIFDIADNSSKSMKSSFIQIYNYTESDYNNVVTLPVTSGLDTAASFTRTGAEGAIPCYVNPTSDLDFITNPDDYYKGCVKAYNINNANNEARLMTNLDEVLDSTKFYMDNGLIKLETTANSVKYHYWNGTAWTLLNEFGIGTINVIKPLYISPEFIKMQINKTKWTLQRGKQTIKVENPNTDINYTLNGNYFHDGVTAANPVANADISMLTQYYCNVYNTSDRYRMQIIQANTTTIKSDKIPAAEITGIGWYDNNESPGSYNHYLNIAKEFLRQPVQKIGIKRV